MSRPRWYRKTAGTVDRSIGNALDRLLQLLARDVTERLTTGRLLVLAPHPDDETIGCGATISTSLRRGSDVRVVVVTQGDFGYTTRDREFSARIRKRELISATRELGLVAARPLHR